MQHESKSRYVLFSLIIAGALFVASCGGNSSDNTSSDAAAPKSMVDQPAADDGQGIGKYKNDEYGTVDQGLATKGEALFTQKCSACHKLTDQKVVGPGLAGVTKRRSASWVMNMMTNPIEMTKNDPTGKKLLEEHLTQMTFQDVSDESAHQILEFLQKNDSK
jgi:cytochrome c551/c552